MFELDHGPYATEILMRYKLTSIFLVVTLACLAAGWFSEALKRRKLVTEMDRISLQLESYLKRENSAVAAEICNTIYKGMERLDGGEWSGIAFKAEKQESLACVVVELYLNENDEQEQANDADWKLHSVYDSAAVLKIARNSLDLMEFKNADEFLAFMVDSPGFKFGYSRRLYTKQKKLKPGFVDFVKRAFTE